MPAAPGEPLAIVGIGLRLPGGNSTPDAFADFLRTGQSGVRPLPTDRWDRAPASEPTDPTDAAEAPGGIRSARGGFLDRIDQFDAKFFNISPKEADYVDPQQRLVLEVAWEALEDAGIDPTATRHGTNGVYLAVSNMDYAADMAVYSDEELTTYMPTGAALSAVSGRLSYFLGWRGPCVTVDTACSASLVAVHLAAQALRGGETDLALCGGVNTISNPRPYVLASQGNMLAPDGLCKTFDDAADGYGRAEGAAVVALKRLADARRDGDRVYALVRGSAIGQDGESGSLMVPNGTAQEGLIRSALAASGLSPRDISYVEAHGTGTPLGDPIEIGALSAVFGASHTPQEPVTVGSLKTNIGHMESAAGIGGIVKTALQLREGTIYPHLNLTTPSRHIPWDTAPVTVPTTRRPWRAETRRALVNSFGLTGTIAAVVLEQAPEPEPREAAADDGAAHVFTLSAKTGPALRGQIQRYQRLLRGAPETDTGDLCHAAATTRAHLGLRIAGVVRDNEDIARLLERGLTRAAATGRPPAAPRTAFLFSGGGSQYVGMGLPLYRQFAAFREHVDACDRLFAPHLGRSIRDLILGRAEDAELIHRVRFMQPALFTLEYAVARLWLAWGVRPAVLAGHSLGEIAAAAVAGLLTLDDAVTLMAARAHLMDTSPPGAMAAVEGTVDEVGDLVDAHDDVSIAAINGIRQLVLSGGTASLARVEAGLAGRGVKTRRIAVSCASHSPLMAEAADELTKVVAGLTFHEPEFPLVSNLSGRLAEPGELSSPEYWGRHLRYSVRFADGMRAVAERGRHAFLEIGPASDLVGMGKQCLDDAGEHVWLSSLHPDDGDATVARQALAQLYAAGASVDWRAHHRGRERRPVRLPTYAFDRRRHWLPEPAAGPATGGGQPDAHPLLGAETSTPGERADGVRTFAARVGARQPGYLVDHKVMGKVVFPGAGYVEILLALQDAVEGDAGGEIADVVIHQALFLPDDGTVELRTRLRPRPDGRADAEIVSLVEGDEPGFEPFERTHVTAVVGAVVGADPGDALAAVERRLRAGADEPAPAGEARDRRGPDDLYADFAELGVVYGPRFQGVRGAERRGPRLAVGELAGQPAVIGEHLPPVVLDCAFQTLAALAGADDGVAMPVGFARCRLLRKPRGATLRSVLLLHPPAAEGEPPRADLLLLDGARTVFVLEGLTLRQVAGAAPDRDRMYSEVRWVKRAARQAEPRERRVLLIGADEAGAAALAERAAADGIAVATAADAAGALAALRERPTDVCWFWRPSADPGETLRALCERNYDALLALRDALAQVGFGQAGSGQGQRLWLVTEGAQWLPGDGADEGGVAPPAAATLWGFGHVLWTEHPSYRATLVDLPPGGGSYLPLLDEWRAGESADYQVAHRRGLRHVRRVFEGTGGPRRDVELVVREHGRFSGVAAVPLPAGPEAEPEKDRIRVLVHAAGLSLRDVFTVLGLAPRNGDEPGGRPLGQQCAGVVTAAGPDAAFRVGDRVMVTGLGCLRGEVTVDSSAAVAVPEGLGLAEAATFPVPFLAAHHAVHHLAGVGAGDRVLVHATADGVGWAAAQLALRAGAEVLVVTGAADVWRAARSQRACHVIGSPAFDFADEVRSATGGAGVDVVIDSFTREFSEAALAVAAPGGRFVGLGADGTMTRDEVRAARPDLAYLDRAAVSEDEVLALVRDTLAALTWRLAAGELAPLPTTVYGLDEVEEAFGALSRGVDVGAVAIGFEPEVLGAPPAAPPVRISPDETYLVTGGLGSLGRLVAKRLADLGARHIALMSRRAPDAATLAEVRAALGPEADVVCHSGDVGDADDVRRVAEALRSGPRPLGGIVHAAGVLADAPVAAQTRESVDAVFRAKVHGSWHLHEAARSFPGLRFFIGYSSVSATLGSRGQANYAAGNAFLDALMCRRAAAGLPGMSVNWGAWGEIGLAAGMDAQHIANIEHQGFSFFKPASGIRALFRLLDRPPARAAVAQVTIAEVDWDRCAATRPQPNALYDEVSRASTRSGVEVDLAALLELSRAERREAVGDVVRAVIADLLHFDSPDDVSEAAAFFEIGLDSLAAVELKNALELCFRVPLSTASVFDHPTVGALAAFVEERLTSPAETSPAEEGALR
ncbi:type I polyketide synthase [Streptomyces radicis]|uniref:SDR family NAD(P)-dependent oxidoreductase n=1 Tax=Streptomyces radicis TaxID=1750517 RepID=A0A3A9X246_9ACTN|nr:type I polyketide synthase [Streptomyces radicis]RKN12587.1 SDR family NAD(P)-dependent oxidoreductase [Streptomyces radicis]RKN27649.1 SDR family NAD(P)-dependent oxidoreductase [Streptomyces radicis]